MNFSSSSPEQSPRTLPRHLGLTGRLRFLARNRYQLIGASLIAVFLPAVLRSQFAFLNLSFQSAENTVLGTWVSVLFGAYVLRRMSSYSGVSALSYVVPVFAATYAAAILVFFFLRLDYSRAQYLLSFVFAVSWFFFVLVIERRVRRPVLLLLPFGHAPSLQERKEADWILAKSAEEPPEHCSGVVADLRADMPAEWHRMLAHAALQSLPVHHSKQVAESLSGRVEIEHLSENNLGSLLPSSIYLRFQRIADLVGTLMALPFAIPVCLFVALAIKLDDGGPVLYSQPRMGFRARPFVIYKFRTMHVTADAGKKFTGKKDPRITRVGRFLRRFRLDELPQIINILKGEMSWIGPRPESLPLSEGYEKKIPFYSYRHIVRPGITGWAQVHQGNVAEVEAATSKLHYDFYYIKHFSLWLDLLIVAKTIRTVLTGFGAR